MSGIMYKNRPYAGGGGAGGASALSDLTDTSISSPTNGQVLKYNNGFWENGNESGGTTVVANPTGTASAQLNKLQVGNDIYSIPSGGGGGGSSITYGYINPSDAASDGDVYYLLDANDKKKGLFLYMTDEWVLIDGSSVFTLTLNLLDSLVQQNYSVGNTVYTALSSKRLIAVNFNVNGEASSKNLTSQIMTAGGTVVSTNTKTANWSNPNRNHSSTVSIIDVDANDTVTLTGITDSGSYTTQLHAILEVTDLVSTTITLEEYAAKSDGNMGTSKTVSLSGKLYMIIVFESSGTGATDMSVGLTTTSTSAVDEDIQIPSMFAAKIMIVDTTEEAASVTMTWASKTNYVSRGYAIYSLT